MSHLDVDLRRGRQSRYVEDISLHDAGNEPL